VLNILIRVYENLIAKYDIDAFRIDTVKYVAPDAVQAFGNSMREFAYSIGKKNFFTFGEIYDQEDVINDFIGRHSTAVDGFGLDVALDFPTFYSLPAVAKGLSGVETVRSVFERRKKAEAGQMSSHGEAGKYFVSFLDNHDQNQRFNHPAAQTAQISLGLAVLFSLQGIPCLYYGTEQGLQGTVDANGQSDFSGLESVREALWGKTPEAFDQRHPLYVQMRAIAQLRNSEPALRYGRLYFREISGNGSDFGQSTGAGGILAYSRILFDREVVVVANTSTTQGFKGQVLMDIDLNRPPATFSIAYSNLGKQATRTGAIIRGARFYDAGTQTGVADIAALEVDLSPMEAQIFVPQ
jgi:glycosidase